jgi:hypothetical protein
MWLRKPTESATARVHRLISWRDENAIGFCHTAALALSAISHSIHDPRFDVFAPSAPFERQFGSETSTRCQSSVLDSDGLAGGRGYALVHDGRLSPACDAKTVELV